MYVLFAPPAECLRCDESRRTKSDTEAFGRPTAAISDIGMSFVSCGWNLLPRKCIAATENGTRAAGTDRLLLFTSSTCLEGTWKAESRDFPHLKCPLTLATASKGDLHRVCLAWNKWGELLVCPSGSLPCTSTNILPSWRRKQLQPLMRTWISSTQMLHTRVEGLKWEIRFHHWYWSRSTCSA